MKNHNKTGAVGALLDEYKKAIGELQQVIKNISRPELIKPLPTQNKECGSIQAILTHVVSSGYSYCVYIQNLREPNVRRPEKAFRSSAAEYINDLDAVFRFTIETFSNLQDEDLEEFDRDKKISTAWGQHYDIEQLFEHAIVHVLRHRRQIEKQTMNLYAKAL